MNLESENKRLQEQIKALKEAGKIVVEASKAKTAAHLKLGLSMAIPLLIEAMEDTK